MPVTQQVLCIRNLLYPPILDLSSGTEFRLASAIRNSPHWTECLRPEQFWILKERREKSRPRIITCK